MLNAVLAVIDIRFQVFIVSAGRFDQGVVIVHRLFIFLVKERGPLFIF